MTRIAPLDSFAALSRFLGTLDSRRSPWGGDTTTVRRRAAWEGGGIAVRHHRTDVLTFLESGDVLVSHLGYSVTTRRRHSWFAPAGWELRGSLVRTPWGVEYRTHRATLRSDGTVGPFPGDDEVPRSLEVLRAENRAACAVLVPARRVLAGWLRSQGAADVSVRRDAGNTGGTSTVVTWSGGPSDRATHAQWDTVAAAAGVPVGADDVWCSREDVLEDVAAACVAVALGGDTKHAQDVANGDASADTLPAAARTIAPVLVTLAQDKHGVRLSRYDVKHTCEAWGVHELAALAGVELED